MEAVIALLLAETVPAVAMLGQTMASHLAGYATVRGALTLVGQISFALIPLLVPRRQDGVVRKR